MIDFLMFMLFIYVAGSFVRMVQLKKEGKTPKDKLFKEALKWPKALYNKLRNL